MKNAYDLVGETLSNWTVVRHSGFDEKRKLHLYIARCKCGNIEEKNRDFLKKQRSTYCRKCRNNKEAKYSKNLSRNALYNTWSNMRGRCLNKNSQAFKYYGGRGIKITKKWDKFENFLKDMGPRPKGTSLNRINNDGNYCKSNCNWATSTEQSNNTRRARLYEYNGETLNISDWAIKLSIGWQTLASFLNRSKDRTIEKAIRYYTEMSNEEKSEFNTISKGRFCYFNGERRSYTYISKRLCVNVGSFQQRVIDSSCKSAIDYYSTPKKTRMLKASNLRHKLYKHNGFEKTCSSWARLLRCDRHSLSRSIKAIGFDKAIKAYDIPRKGKTSQMVSNERNKRIRLLTGNLKLYNYNGESLSIPEIAKKLQISEQYLLKLVKKLGINGAALYLEQPKKERLLKARQGDFQNRISSGVVKSYYFDGLRLTIPSIAKELKVPETSLRERTRKYGMQKAIEYYENKKKK